VTDRQSDRQTDQPTDRPRYLACNNRLHRRMYYSDHHNKWSKIATADGFNRICQVAPMCPPMRVHWRHLANTIELVLPSAHSSPQPQRKWTGSGIFAQLMAECCRACPGMFFPLIIAPSITITTVICTAPLQVDRGRITQFKCCFQTRRMMR